MTDFDLVAARRHLQQLAQGGHGHALYLQADMYARELAELHGQHDAAVATLKLLRGGENDFDLHAALGEIRAQTAGQGCPLADIAVRLAYRLFVATRGAGIVAVDALARDDASEEMASLIGLSDQLCGEVDHRDALLTAVLPLVDATEHPALHDQIAAAIAHSNTETGATHS